MPDPAYLGEFEQQVLLVVLRLKDEAFGPDISRELEDRAGRRVSRGALYTTFDRLEDKGLLRWRTIPGTASCCFRATSNCTISMSPPAATSRTRSST